MRSAVGPRKKLLFFVTEDWYFVSHRLPLAVAARKAGYDVCVVTRARKHARQIEGAGLRLIPFELARGGINPLSELWTLLRLIQVYRRERPDIAHHVAMKPVLYGSIAARFGRPPRMLNALAGMGWLFISDGWLAGRLKPAVRYTLGKVMSSGLALVQNPDDQRLLLHLGVPAENVRRIAGSGVDLVLFSPQPELTGVPVVVLPSRLLWDKGVGEFVAAARLLAGKGVQARFVLAGEPDPLNPAAISTAQIQEWVRDGVVEHMGWVSDMPALLASSHIVCLPSYREGLPKALTEAAAAGRPIVTTDVPGCRDVVRDGDSGILVPPRDHNALAAALERLIADPELRARMGARGRVRAEQEFGSEIAIRQTLALYAELAE